MCDDEVDPLTPEALKALRLAVSGKETGLEHHSDRSLARFLRAKKTVERAAENVKSYDAFRKEIGIEGVLEYEKVAETHALGFMLFDPATCYNKDGAVIVHGRPGKLQGKPTPEELQRMVFYVIDWLTISNEAAQTKGVMMIMDWTDMSLLKFNRKYPQMIAPMIQNVLPVRMKMIAHVNVPGFFSMIFALLKPLLSKKIRSRLKVLGAPENLLEFVDKEHLPLLLGGDVDLTLENNRLLIKAGPDHASKNVAGLQMTN